MTLATMELQHALATKLQGDGVLTGLVNGLYDAPPQGAALPYLVFGEGEARIVPAEGPVLTETALEIEVWTDTSGRKTALMILNRLYALLHYGTLSLTGFQQVVLRVEQSSISLTEEATRLRGGLRVVATLVEA